VSYLHPVRLHFSGRFRADVSTVNNDASHYDNAHFSPDFQKPGAGVTNGWWQPAGTGAWRLLDCTVSRVCRADGSVASSPTEDLALGLKVSDAADRSSAKMVDLDPDQQGVSMIFGLGVRLIDDQGRVLVQGEFDPVAFFDLNFARSSAGGPAGASAYFQSVLKNVVWGDTTGSPCLAQMRQASTEQALSIKFITDRYLLGGPQRGYGRIIGTLGPYLAGEPRTFIIGRHLAPPQQNQFAPADCRLDAARRKVLVDVGNALPIDKDSGDFLNSGEITLVVGDDANATTIDTLDYTGPRNYAQTAGIYELPSTRALTDAELAAVANKPLRLLARQQGAATPDVIAAENDDGVYVRAEPFVFRLDPGGSATTELIVTEFGVPMVGATPQAQAQPFSVPDKSPLPTLTLDPKTDANGRAKLTISAVDAGSPRQFVDGQVYAISFSLQESPTDPSTFDAANFISLLMFGRPTTPVALAWDDVHPVFAQYSHLYPRPHGPDPYMPFADLPPSHPVVNLDDYDSVAAFARHIVWALELPIDHPSHMPVTRDLSDAKRALLLRWLREVGADGEPRRTVTSTAAANAVAGPALHQAAPRFAAQAFNANPKLTRHQPADAL
jgi:hypothetical protein